MSMKPPQTVSELFPDPWLRPDDLNGRSYTMTISRVTFDMLHNPRTNKKELKAILSFEGARKKLPLNKTQALAIADIIGTETFEEWPGYRITLKPGLTNSKQETIDFTVPPHPVADAMIEGTYPDSVGQLDEEE